MPKKKRKQAGKAARVARSEGMREVKENRASKKANKVTSCVWFLFFMRYLLLLWSNTGKKMTALLLAAEGGQAALVQVRRNKSNRGYKLLICRSLPPTPFPF
jgi:hypothetical protein